MLRQLQPLLEVAAHTQDRGQIQETHQPENQFYHHLPQQEVRGWQAASEGQTSTRMKEEESTSR